jgi:hypothetical protein
MQNRLSTLALATVLAVGASSMALAQTCPPGYMFDGAYCQPTGGIVGGALNAAGAIVGGTVGAVTGYPPYPPPPPAYGSSSPPLPGNVTISCPVGYVLDAGACWPVR